MFDMIRIGRRIAELRRNAGRTQMELADRMEISFQAVSNWERGETMPDIAKLPQLAEIFGITVDDLLGQRAPLVEHAAAGNAEAYAKENGVTVEELAEAAPILQPQQVRQAAVHLEVRDVSEIAGLLPFLDTALIDDLARRADARGESVGAFLPFVSNRCLSELFEARCARDGVGRCAQFFPFLPRDTLRKAARQLYEEEGMNGILSIAPFLDKETLNDIAAMSLT